MGAWGPGSFENDDALDFVAGLLEESDKLGKDGRSPRAEMVVGALVVALKPEGMLDDDGDDDEDDESESDDDFDGDDTETVALAAAEIVAACNGKPSKDLAATADGEDDEGDLGELAKWCAGRGRKDATLALPKVRELARDTVAKIRTSGGLADLWREAAAADGANWSRAVDDLLARLK